MTLEMFLMAAILLAAVSLFALEVFPVDKVSVIVLGALVLTRLVTPEQAVSGFGNPATITVACMLALSFAIQQSGGLNFVAGRIVSLASGSEVKIIGAVILAVGFLSAFINNTAAVALFLPLTISVARRQGLSPARILMPMSFAAMMAGMCTLVGTSTNLLVSAIARNSMGWQMGLFEFLELGLVFFVVGSAYMLLVGRHLLPRREPKQSLTDDYRLRHFFSELAVHDDSQLIGATPAETRFGELYDLEIIEIIRGEVRLLPDAKEARLEAGDILLVRGQPESLVAIREEKGVELKALQLSDSDLEDDDIVLVEAFVAPNSRLVESTLKEVDFRRNFLSTALAIRSHGRNIREKIGKVRLEFGDSLLILTRQPQLARLHESPDFLVLEELEMQRTPQGTFLWAAGIFVAIIAAAAVGWLTILEAAVVGLGLMVLTGCLRLNDLYSKISWQTIVMLGCLIPMGQAMENTGLAALAASTMVEMVSDLGPVAILSGLYLLTSLLTSIMSNNATAVLMAPIALQMATQINVDPKPLVIAVMFAASSSFVTPVGYQTNLFIFGPGGYKFSDFLRVGGPLNFVFWVMATLLIPLFWPL